MNPSPAFELIPTDSSSLHMVEAIQGGGVFAVEPYGDWTVYQKEAEFIGFLVQAGLVTDSFPSTSTIHQANAYALRWVSICMILNKSRELVFNHWMNQPTRQARNPGAGHQKMLWLPQPERPAAFRMRSVNDPGIAPDRGVLFHHLYGFHYVRPVESGFSGKLVLHDIVVDRFDNVAKAEAEAYLQEWASASRHYVSSMIFAQGHLPQHRFAQLISYRGPESNVPKDFNPLKKFDDAESINTSDIELYLNARKGLSASLPHGMWSVWPDKENHSGEFLQYRARTDHFEQLGSPEVIQILLRWTHLAETGEQPEYHG